MTAHTQRICIENTEILIEGNEPETMVMVHGWPDSYRLWDAQVAALNDLTGFLLRVVEQMPVILLLHDWGCLFGYQFARLYPERVSSIIGVDVGDRFEMMPKGIALTLAYQTWLTLGWWIGGSVGNVLTRTLRCLMYVPQNPAEVTAGMNYPYFLIWFGGQESCLCTSKPFFPACPMLYIYRQHKQMMFHSPGWLRKLQACPDCQVASFETAHWVMLQQSKRFNRILLDWLKGRA